MLENLNVQCRFINKTGTVGMLGYDYAAVQLSVVVANTPDVRSVTIGDGWWWLVMVGDSTQYLSMYDEYWVNVVSGGYKVWGKARM
jgi:hypothetical protein